MICTGSIDKKQAPKGIVRTSKQQEKEGSEIQREENQEMENVHSYQRKITDSDTYHTSVRITEEKSV